MTYDWFYAGSQGTSTEHCIALNPALTLALSDNTAFLYRSPKVEIWSARRETCRRSTLTITETRLSFPKTMSKAQVPSVTDFGGCWGETTILIAVSVIT